MEIQSYKSKMKLSMVIHAQVDLGEFEICQADLQRETRSQNKTIKIGLHREFHTSKGYIVIPCLKKLKKKN